MSCHRSGDRAGAGAGIPDGGAEMIAALLAIVCPSFIIVSGIFLLALCKAAARGDEQLGIRDEE